jgi:Ser/Thr protein kinase RdoA (MazF antagonist)
MKPSPSPWPVAEAFGLGAPTGPLVAIASRPSAVHRSWRLSTRRGRLAVKAFDQDLRASSAAALEGPVRLELAAFAAGVPMPRPCLAVETGAGIAEVAGLGPQPLFVRVHERVEGTTPTAPAPMGLAAELGAALARHWQALVEQAEGAGCEWTGRLRAALPLLVEVEALVAARTAEPVPLLVTHSDLVPGNVVVSVQGRVWIVDWDDAGPWNAAEEVAAAVVSWSSGVGGEPNQRAARALVEGYRATGRGLESHSPTVLAGSLSAVANWLELNLRRSLDQAAGRPFRRRAEAEATGALAELSRRLARLDRWTKLLG